MTGRPPKATEPVARVEAWPAAWRTLWEAALAPPSFLDEGSVASSWSLRRRRQAEWDVGRFIRWLEHASPAALTAASLGAAATPERLAAFTQAEVARGVRFSTTATVLGNIIGVGRSMDPDLDPGHLAQCWRVVDAVKRRARSEPCTPRTVADPQALYAAGLEHMEGALGDDDVVADPDAWQAGLMVALLTAAPIRIANFAALGLGRHLVEAGGRLVISLDAGETKTRRSDCWEVPGSLEPYLQHFIQQVRPAMLHRSRSAARHDRLWVGAFGQPLEHQAVRQRVAAVTTLRLGRAVLPHSFRHAAATAFLVDHPDRPRDAAALLGHTGYGTTERHYVLSDRQLALRKMQKALDAVRSGQTDRGRPRQRPCDGADEPW